MRARPPLSSLALLATLSLSRAGLADDGADKLAAEALFAEGRALLKAGKHDAACDKFDKSQRLDPSVGTLFNLAECAARRGATATAWLRYREAGALATRSGDRERARIAEERANALVVPKLVIRDEGKTERLVVRRDGAVVDPMLLGVATPVDPGRHVIEAQAPGREPFRVEITVPTNGEITVVVPTLAAAPARDRPPSSPPPSETRSRALPLVVGGVGIAAIGAGAFFGVRATSTWGDVTDACPDRRCPDPTTASRLDADRASAMTDAVASTVLVGAGVVAVAVAAYLWLTDRGSSATTAARGALTF